MATIQLPPDFKEFLRLFGAREVRYLIVGGYAVGYHGYPRPTGDLDLWVGSSLDNAARVVAVLKEFGFNLPEVSEELFLREKQVIRLGLPPIRIEIITSASGVDFNECYERAVLDDIDSVPVRIIALEDLKINKKAAGRHKDLNDLEVLFGRGGEGKE